MPAPILLIGLGAAAVGGALMTPLGRRTALRGARTGAESACRIAAEAVEEVEDIVAEIRADIAERGFGAMRPRRGPLSGRRSRDDARRDGRHG